jgi:hypothetical protein
MIIIILASYGEGIFAEKFITVTSSIFRALKSFHNDLGGGIYANSNVLCFFLFIYYLLFFLMIYI